MTVKTYSRKYSFHETKNIISGEGGALLINDPAFAERAEMVREQGTNRSKFYRSQVDKYTWIDVCSSYSPSKIIAAFLWAQIQEVDSITARRLAIWENYYAALESLETVGRLRRPVIPNSCGHNAHIYYLLLRDLEDRAQFIHAMKNKGAHCVFQYVPLHNSPYRQKLAFTQGDLPVTEKLADCLVRLPLWLGLNQSFMSCIIRCLSE